MLARSALSLQMVVLSIWQSPPAQKIMPIQHPDCDVASTFGALNPPCTSAGMLIGIPLIVGLIISILLAEPFLEVARGYNHEVFALTDKEKVEGAKEIRTHELRLRMAAAIGRSPPIAEMEMQVHLSPVSCLTLLAPALRQQQRMLCTVHLLSGRQKVQTLAEGSSDGEDRHEHFEVVCCRLFVSCKERILLHLHPALLSPVCQDQACSPSPTILHCAFSITHRPADRAEAGGPPPARGVHRAQAQVPAAPAVRYSDRDHLFCHAAVHARRASEPVLHHDPHLWRSL